MASVKACRECQSEEVARVGADFICRACQARWEPTIAEAFGGEEAFWHAAADINDKVRLLYPTCVLSGVRHPQPGDLELGLAGLSERKLRNRLGKTADAIALIGEVERIVAENLLRDWDWDGKPDSERAFERQAGLSGERAVAALDRMLKRTEDFEGMWQRRGRLPEALQRTPWEFPGRQLARDIGLFAAEREFLQVAQTLLSERVALRVAS